MWCLNLFKILLRPNKKYLCLGFPDPTKIYLWNLEFIQVSGKSIILCILKGEMPFKMHKIIFFQKKKNTKK